MKFALIALALACGCAVWWAQSDPTRAINVLTQAWLSAQGKVGSTQLNQPYGPGAAQQSDVYLPPADLPRPAHGWPVVVFFHGGSWVRGHRSEYRFVGQALASRGMVAVMADYRLYPEVKYPEFLRDGAALVAWVLQQAPTWQADAHQVFTMGHSAGAYNAAMLAVDPRWLGEVGLSPQALAGWIGLAGPYDFLPIEDVEVKPVFDHPHSPPDSQVVFHARVGGPPAWLAYAPQDPYVNPQVNSIRLGERLRALGVPSTLREVAQANHVSLVGMLSPVLSPWVPLLDEVSDFVHHTQGPRPQTEAVFSRPASS